MVAICYTSFSLYFVPYETLKDIKRLLDSDFYVTFWTNIYLNNYVYLGAALWLQWVTGDVFFYVPRTVHLNITLANDQLDA